MRSRSFCQGILLVGCLILFISFCLDAAEAKDYYSILGVSRQATIKEIKKAYRTLSKDFHPDRFPGDKEIEQKYILINEAHDVLKDEEKRRTYDIHGEEGLKQGQGQRGRGQGFDPFADFFGFGRQRDSGGLREGPSLDIPLEVTLKDLYVGKQMEVFHKKQVLCRHCRGTGAENFDDVKKCGTCHGSGRVVTERRQGNMIFQQQATCNTCGGTGQTIATKCSVCGGSKISHGSEYLPLFVEKGMSDGQRITFRGACDQQPDTHPGDLHFVITTQRHPTFAREGNNLRIKMQITLLEALVGFSKTLRHLDGHEFTVARTAITTPGFVQKIPQEGMPIHEATTFGDLFVEYSIRFPKQLSDAQKQAFRELLR